MNRSILVEQIKKFSSKEVKDFGKPEQFKNKEWILEKLNELEAVA